MTESQTTVLVEQLAAAGVDIQPAHPPLALSHDDRLDLHLLDAPDLFERLVQS